MSRRALTFEPGALARVRLRTADGRNTLSRSVLDEVREVLALVAADDRTRMVVLAGDGRTFSLGADVEEIDALDVDEVAPFVEEGRAVVRALAELPVPVLAAIGGQALGGGFELALACDLRWAHVRASFAFPESGLGLVPAWGGIELANHHLPPALAHELLEGGGRLSARRAFELGLVGRLFEGGDFLDQVTAAAAELPSTSAEGMRARVSPAWDDGAVVTRFLELWKERQRERDEAVGGSKR